MSGQPPEERLVPLRPDLEAEDSRFGRAAIVAVVLSLVFAAAFSAPASTFWGNFGGQLAGFILAGWVASRVARRRGTLAVATGFGLSWIAVLLLTFWRLPVRDTLAILSYVGGGILAAGGGEFLRRRKAQRST